jgi:hypothetical protein
MSPRIINQPLLKSIHLFGGYEKTLLRHGCMAPATGANRLSSLGFPASF